MARNANSEALHGFERDRDAGMGITQHRNMLNGIVHGAFFHMASAFADRAIYLEKGLVRADGPADAVIARYRSDIAGERAPEIDNRTPVRILEEGRRWGNGDIEILNVEILSDGKKHRLIPSGEECEIVIHYRCRAEQKDFVFGIAWHAADGTLIAGHNTDLDAMKGQLISGESSVRCRYEHLPLAAGNYRIDIAIHAADGLAYDYWCNAVDLQVTAPVDYPGFWAPAHEWKGPEGLWK